MILAARTLRAVQGACETAQTRERSGDLRGALLFTLEAQKLLLVAQAQLSEQAIYPEDRTAEVEG